MRVYIKTKNYLILFLITIFTFTLSSCSTKPVEKETARGYIWEATKDDKTVTLVGTMHIGNDNVSLLNDDIKQIIADTDVLSVEVDLSVPSNLSEIQAAGYLSKEDNIENYLSKDEIEKLSSIYKALEPNFNIDQVKNFTSYFLSSLLTNLIYSHAGISGPGLDALMINSMNSRLRKGEDVQINELEGVDNQLETLNLLFSWDSFKDLINESYEIVIVEKNAKEEPLKLFEIYTNGDIDSMAEIYNQQKIDDPESYKILLLDRNILMANKIDELIKDGRKHTVAVGAGHFVGDDSILKLLEEKGYTITRVN